MEQKEQVRQERWAASRRAEEQGDIVKALEIHSGLISEESPSYAIMVRAGWLYYQLGLYEVALRYYELACSVSKDDWPLHGIKNCLIAMRKTYTLPEVGKLVRETDETRPLICEELRPPGISE
jgi:tetratricopeptide (TPR) repeat protein